MIVGEVLEGVLERVLEEYLRGTWEVLWKSIVFITQALEEKQCEEAAKSVNYSKPFRSIQVYSKREIGSKLF